MTINRAWTRRAYASPAPFAVAITRTWAETLVTISRAVLVDDGKGGFLKSPPRDLFSVYAHADLEQLERPKGIDEPWGMVQERYWTIYMDVPPGLDPSLYPKKGDWLDFTDDMSIHLHLPVRYVHSPDTVLDHFEIESEAVE